jgi:hypothetical protein
VTETVYLTEYDGLLCGDCALDTSGLLNEGRNWLARLTAVPATEVLAEWPEARCEECKKEVQS